jgi:hypothetical protein
LQAFGLELDNLLGLAHTVQAMQVWIRLPHDQPPYHRGEPLMSVNKNVSLSVATNPVCFVEVASRTNQ